MSEKYKFANFDTKAALIHFTADRIEENHLTLEQAAIINEEGWTVPGVGTVRLKEDGLPLSYEFAQSKDRHDGSNVEDAQQHLINIGSAILIEHDFSFMRGEPDLSYQKAHEMNQGEGLIVTQPEHVYLMTSDGEKRVEADVKLTEVGFEQAWSQYQEYKIHRKIVSLSEEMLNNRHELHKPNIDVYQSTKDLTEQINESREGWQIPGGGSYRLFPDMIPDMVQEVYMQIQLNEAMREAVRENNATYQIPVIDTVESFTRIASLVLDDGKMQTLAQAREQNERPEGFHVKDVGAFRFSESTLEHAWEKIPSHEHVQTLVMSSHRDEDRSR